MDTSYVPNFSEPVSIAGTAIHLYSNNFEKQLLFDNHPQTAWDENRLRFNPVISHLELTISTSGIPGRPGFDGSSGHYGGGRGEDGGNGSSGANAERSIIGISASEDTIVVNRALPPIRGNSAAQYESVVFPLRDQIRIAAFALGGEGGRAGDGGRGGSGTPGYSGSDATRYSSGTNGGPGGRGGDGGNGGRGGDAGNSANIEIYVKQEDLDLLTSFHCLQCHSMRGGAGGSGGSGGSGGPGGRGGSSYSWTETSSYYDSSSKSYRTIYTHRSNPGGSSGWSGASGSRGENGEKGRDGNAGSVYYLVSYRNPALSTGCSIRVSNQIYNLQLRRVRFAGINSGIFEPGQVISIYDIAVVNSGGMDSPPHLELSIDGMSPVSRYLQVVRPSIRTNIMISPSSSEELITSNNQNLSFKLLPPSEPIIPENTCLSIDTVLLLQAKLYRTGYIFTPFHAPSSSDYQIRIQYPVEISMISGNRSGLFDAKLPWAIKLLNKSHYAIGDKAGSNSPRRLLKLKIEIQPGSETAPLFTSENLLFEMLKEDGSYERFDLVNDPVVFNISHLSPLKEATFRGSLSIRRNAIPIYSSLQLQFSLFLGDIDEPMEVKKMHRIQRELYHVQITEARKETLRNHQGMMILVINSDVPRSEIFYWLGIVQSLGYEVNVWNVSLYNGISYDQPNYSLLENCPDSVVIFLNLPFEMSNSSEQKDKIHPLRYLEPSEIFEAARRYGIRTFVINNGEESYRSNGDGNDVLQQLRDLMLPGRQYTPAAAAAIGDNEVVPPTTSLKVPTQNRFDGRREFMKSLLKPDNHYYRREEKVAASHPSAYQSIMIKYFHVFTTPKENKFHHRAEEFIDMLQEQRPDRNYYIKKHYQSAQKTKGTIFKRYECGTVEVRRGLERTHSMVVCRGLSNKLRIARSELDPESQQRQIDLFLLLKLLPFSQKLQLLDRYCTSDEGYSALKQPALDVKVEIVSTVGLVDGANETSDSKNGVVSRPVYEKLEEPLKGKADSEPEPATAPPFVAPDEASPSTAPIAFAAATKLATSLSLNSSPLQPRLFNVDQIVEVILSDIMDEMAVYFTHINKIRFPWTQYNNKLQAKEIFLTLALIKSFNFVSKVSSSSGQSSSSPLITNILQSLLVKTSLMNRLYHKSNYIGNALTPQLSKVLLEAYQHHIDSKMTASGLEKLTKEESERCASFLQKKIGKREEKVKLNADIVLQSYRDPYDLLPRVNQLHVFLSNWVTNGMLELQIRENERLNNPSTISFLKFSLDDHFMDGEVLKERIVTTAQQVQYHPKGNHPNLQYLHYSDLRIVDAVDAQEGTVFSKERLSVF